MWAFIFLAICFYFLFRNFKVYYFLQNVKRVLDIYLENKEYSSYQEIDQVKEAVSKFWRKYTYENLLFHIKPLRLRYWWTKEEIEQFRINQNSELINKIK